MIINDGFRRTKSKIWPFYTIFFILVFLRILGTRGVNLINPSFRRKTQTISIWIDFAAQIRSFDCPLVCWKELGFASFFPTDLDNQTFLTLLLSQFKTRSFFSCASDNMDFNFLKLNFISSSEGRVYKLI